LNNDEERLILKLYSKEKLEQEKEYIVQTGLYAGVLFYKGCKINITTKYGDAFLKRMLNFVNDIYVDNEQVKAKKDETENQFLFIIAYLFIQSLKRQPYWVCHNNTKSIRKEATRLEAVLILTTT
jgi:5-methylcytosine-specific restriction enzyme subunit McrC